MIDWRLCCSGDLEPVWYCSSEGEDILRALETGGGSSTEALPYMLARRMPGSCCSWPGACWPCQLVDGPAVLVDNAVNASAAEASCAVLDGWLKLYGGCEETEVCGDACDCSGDWTCCIDSLRSVGDRASPGGAGFSSEDRLNDMLSGLHGAKMVSH